MKISTTSLLLVVICGTLAAEAFLLSRESDRQTAAKEFFSNTLKDAEISEIVSVQDHTYLVQNGSIISQESSGQKDYQILSLAYALSLARRDPLLALAGTNPAALKESAMRLISAQATLKEAQMSAPERDAIENLYPSKFLLHLAELEALRQTFLSSGSDVDEERYRAQLRTTIESGLEAIRRFSDSFGKIVVGEDETILPGFGGAISVTNLRNAMKEIESGLVHTRDRFHARQRCLRGAINACDKSELWLQPLENVSHKAQVAHPPLLNEIRLLLAEAKELPNSVSNRIVALDESVCLQTFPGPYFFSAPLATSDSPSPLPMFLNEVFFLKTHTTAAMLAYLLNDLHIAYSLAHPLLYYRCPDVGKDIGTIIAIKEVAMFARDNKLGTTVMRQLFPSANVYDSDKSARAYVDYALTTTTSSSTYNQLLELRLMMQNSSAGLERIVDSIARTSRNDAAGKTRGIPFEVDAKTLFLAYSAFLTLFQTYNPSFGSNAGVETRVEDPAAIQAFLDKHASYSELRASVPREKILHDLRAFFLFERPERAGSGNSTLDPK